LNYINNSLMSYFRHFFRIVFVFVFVFVFRQNGKSNRDYQGITRKT
jgi:cbb3-type cytochrome oxidase subunit 3